MRLSIQQIVTVHSCVKTLFVPSPYFHSQKPKSKSSNKKQPEFSPCDRPLGVKESQQRTQFLLLLPSSACVDARCSPTAPTTGSSKMLLYQDFTGSPRTIHLANQILQLQLFGGIFFARFFILDV